MNNNGATEAQAYETLRLAQIHETEGQMASSAQLAASDAAAAFNVGDYAHAAKRAAMSLRYSVGIFHTDYQAAARIAR